MGYFKLTTNLMLGALTVQGWWSSFNACENLILRVQENLMEKA